jgi:hypothetical protein
MSKNKTQPTAASVTEFINAVENEQKRKDAFEVLEMISAITGEQPVIWGPSLIGFGKYHYKYESGREGDFFIAGFSPRKTALTIYILSGMSKFPNLMAKLGKYKTGKSCLYLKKLDDIDRPVLKELMSESVKWMKENYEVE